MFKVGNFFLNTRLQPWLCALLAATLVALLAWLGPQQIPVVIYKLLLPLLGGSVLLFVWLALVPFANPSRYLRKNWRDDPDADVDDGPDFSVVVGYYGVFCSCVTGCALVFSAGALSVGLAL